MSHPIRCGCGNLRGHISDGAAINRGICYCRDCQAFAFALGAQTRVLDERGGTEIVQTAASAVRFDAGQQHLACLRLTSNGLMRWYARCCDTPIGNTAATSRLGFVGLIHCCLREAPLDRLGPSHMRVNTASARGEPKPKAQLPLAGALTLARIMLPPLFIASRRDSPFFPHGGGPVATPRVLSTDEHAAAYRSIAPV